MDDQTLGTIIGGLLASGCGGANQLVLANLIKWKDEDGDPISPKTKRRLSLVLAFATPSLLYAFMVWMGWTTYGIAAHVSYMGLAFAAHQALHGETKLQTGEEVRAAQVVAFRAAQPAFVGNIPQGHTPPVLPISPVAPVFDDVDETNSGDVQPFPDGQRGASGGM